MTISPVNHFRNNPKDWSDLDQAVSALQEYTEYLQELLSELNCSANSDPTDEQKAARKVDEELEDDLNATLEQARDEILGAALDLASLLNKAAKSELGLKITELRNSELPSNSEIATLEKALAALHVPHRLACQRSIYGAEATVNIAERMPWTSKRSQADALRTIERGKKAMTKEAA